MEFEWDPNKAASNLRKHGVRFAEAVAVLEDHAALSMTDDSALEDRFVAPLCCPRHGLAWKDSRGSLRSSRRSNQNNFGAQGDATGAVAVRGKRRMKREYDFSKARRGPVVPAAPGKTRVTIRLDNDVIEHFQSIVDRAGGGNYQTMINAALREYIQGARLEAVVRRAVRKEVEAVKEALTRTG